MRAARRIAAAFCTGPSLTTHGLTDAVRSQVDTVAGASHRPYAAWHIVRITSTLWWACPLCVNVPAAGTGADEQAASQRERTTS
jgi:hypothetical protein